MAWTQDPIFDDNHLEFLRYPVPTDFTFERNTGLSAESNAIDRQVAQAPTPLRAPTPRSAQPRPQSVSRPMFPFNPVYTGPTAGSSIATNGYGTVVDNRTKQLEEPSIATNGYGTVVTFLDNRTKKLEEQVENMRADIKTIHLEFATQPERTQVLAEFELMRRDFEEMRQQHAEMRQQCADMWQQCADMRLRVQKLVDGLKSSIPSMERDLVKHDEQLKHLNKFATDWTESISQSEVNILGNMKVETGEFIKGEGEGFI